MDIDQKIILLNHQNNFVGILKIMNNAAKKVNILATSYITSYQKVILLQIKYIFKLNLNRININVAEIHTLLFTQFITLCESLTTNHIYANKFDAKIVLIMKNDTRFCRNPI